MKLTQAFENTYITFLFKIQKRDLTFLFVLLNTFSRTIHIGPTLHKIVFRVPKITWTAKTLKGVMWEGVQL